MLNTNKVRFCAEADEYVLETKHGCHGNRECECDCHEGIRYFTCNPEDFGNSPIATVTYDRSFPDEEEPMTNIHISKNNLLYLNTIIADALEQRRLDIIILRIT